MFCGKCEMGEFKIGGFLESSQDRMASARSGP